MSLRSVLISIQKNLKKYIFFKNKLPIEFWVYFALTIGLTILGIGVQYWRRMQSKRDEDDFEMVSKYDRMTGGMTGPESEEEKIKKEEDFFKGL